MIVGFVVGVGVGVGTGVAVGNAVGGPGGEGVSVGASVGVRVSVGTGVDTATGVDVGSKGIVAIVADGAVRVGVPGDGCSSAQPAITRRTTGINITCKIDFMLPYLKPETRDNLTKAFQCVKYPPTMHRF